MAFLGTTTTPSTRLRLLQDSEMFIEGGPLRKAIREYLILLSVCQTCKYMGVDFLDFLRSGEKDIHAFAESRRGRRRRVSASEPKAPPTPLSKTGDIGR